MRLKAWTACAVLMSSALWLAAACGSSHSGLMEAEAGKSGSGGGPGDDDEEECDRNTDCDDQVCSPDGRCIDCYDDDDCRADQICDDERCVSDDDDSGDAGSSSGATGGGGGASGGTGNMGGKGGSGGTGGMEPTIACEDARVLFVIQRSGAMFELPTPLANYWTMVRDAVADPQGAAAAYEAQLDMGALFLVRLSTAASCPTLSTLEPTSPSMASLGALFDENLAAYTAQSLTDKMDAPVAEAVTVAASLLGGPGGHIVLITTAVPDTCTLADSQCTVDPTIKAVQNARAAGILTHVIGLGDVVNLDTTDTQGYERYLEQLANAGRGQPVKMAQYYESVCPTPAPVATYSETSGNAQAYQAFTVEDVRTAVTQILSGICP
jgi:hypothetical protein